jgi:hypothetical protein
VSLSSLLNNLVSMSAPGRKPILLLLQAALRDTLGHFMAVSFNSLLRGFRQAFKSVIMHEHRSLLRSGIDTLDGVFPFSVKIRSCAKMYANLRSRWKWLLNFPWRSFVLSLQIYQFFFQRTLSHSFLHSSLYENGGRFLHTKTTGEPFTSACYRNRRLSLVT